MVRSVLRLVGMTVPHDDLRALRERIIGRAMDVHRALGPGLLESVYRDWLIIELRASGLGVVHERRIDVDYKGHRIAKGLTVDLLVEDAVIVEIKSVERLHPVHSAQLITYLKLTGKLYGLLMNFNAPSLRAGLKCTVHPDLYAKRRFDQPERE
jgi:GxxExxY protein